MKSMSCLLISLLVIGCSAQQSTNKANPAAVYCVESGGEHILETGDCLFRSGQAVNAWEYYRENHPEK